MVQNICETEDHAVRLGIDNYGVPYFERSCKRECYDFNAEYRNNFPTCTFTAAARARGLFYLAGVDSENRPHLFSSLLGGVWEERNLIARQFAGDYISPTGSIIKILEDEEENQIYLICNSGQIVTVTDCAGCVKIRNLPRGDVQNAELRGKNIIVYFADRKTVCVPLRSVVQYHISLFFAEEQQRQGAVIVDLRAGSEFQKRHLRGAINVPNNVMPTWLKEQPAEQTLIFVCKTGVHSEQAACYARKRGYRNSFTLGGMLEMERRKELPPI